MPEQNEMKIVRVLGDEHAKEKNAVVAYQRYIHAEQITFICQRCNQEVTEVRFPGPVKYCPSCSVIVKREKTAARVRAARQKKRELQETKDTV